MKCDIRFQLASKGYAFIEHYAGEAQMTNAVSRVTGLEAARIDLKYHRAMDITKPGGLASEPYINPVALNMRMI